MTGMSSVEVRQQDGVTIVTFGPEYETLYESALSELNEPLLEIGRNADPPVVLIDLPNTTFVGSAFLGLLVRVSNQVKLREGGRFALCRLSPYCQQVIRMTKLSQLWEIYDSPDDAVRQLSRCAK